MEEVYEDNQAPVLVDQQVISKYDLYLNGPINSINQYLDHISIFNSAGEQDVILLHIASEGGNVAVGEQFIQSLQQCKAPVFAVIGMGVASTAAAIALSCTDIIVNDLSSLLIHSFSYGTHDSAGGVFNHAEFNKKLNAKWVNKHFGNFLTESELEDVMKGVDKMFDADEIEERWERILDARLADGEIDADYEDVSEATVATKH